MKKKQYTIIIKGDDIKVRKMPVPPTKVERDKKTYDRKREKRRFSEHDQII